MSLTQTLRITAILLILVAVLQYYLNEQLLIKTIVVAHIIFLLSIFGDKQKQRIAVISAGLAVVVPIGSWKEYDAGDSSLGFFIFNLVIFAYIAFISIKTLMSLRAQ
ncbi:MAG: hypothetical protein ACR2PU_02355 [Gammaproteobacteria bacterium]